MMPLHFPTKSSVVLVAWSFRASAVALNLACPSRPLCPWKIEGSAAAIRRKTLVSTCTRTVADGGAALEKATRTTGAGTAW